VAVFRAADPQTINVYHFDPQKGFLWPKTCRLNDRALKSIVWLRLWKHGNNKKYIYIYILYIPTKNAHLCYVSPLRGNVISQPIAIKFDTLLDLICVINFAKFGVDRSH